MGVRAWFDPLDPEQQLFLEFKNGNSSRAANVTDMVNKQSNEIQLSRDTDAATRSNMLVNQNRIPVRIGCEDTALKLSEQAIHA